MYFPTSAASRLSTVPGLPNLPPELVICLSPSPHKSLFCSLTRNGLAVWRVRPSAVLAYLSRTPKSLIDHGENVDVSWAPDSTRIVVQASSISGTSESYLVLVTIEFQPERNVYETSSVNSRRHFQAGPGEGLPLQGLSLRFEGVVKVQGKLLSVSPRKNHILFTTKSPPAVQRIPWPSPEEDDQISRKEVLHNDNEDEERRIHIGYQTWIFNDDDFDWFVESDVTVVKVLYSRTTGVETWITSDGRAYFVALQENDQFNTSPRGSEDLDNHDIPPENPLDPGFGWQGTCVYDFDTPKWVQKRRRVDPETLSNGQRIYEEPRRAIAAAVNGRFSLVAIGLANGNVCFTNFPTATGNTPSSHILTPPVPYSRKTGSVCSMEWSGDGYVLAVGWQHGWGLFSVGGRCLVSFFGVDDGLGIDPRKFQDMFMYGVSGLFWASGNFELFLLTHPTVQRNRDDGQIFVVPFAKSATTGQLTPDNTRYAFLQMDDRALIYRGADQPDMSVINPDSDVWQHVKIPQQYLANNWPIKHSSLSSDGRLIAIAGRRGLIHYSSSSGRWKIFGDEIQEQAFTVKGGMLWFHHVLIAAVEVSKAYQIRLYSRDLELSNQNVLHREILSSPVVIMSLVDNSLLVYTADNTLFHYLIVPTTDTIKLHPCGSITFSGIIAAPGAVRMLSWLIPSAQKQLGDPADDLLSATVLMVVGGQLVLLRPRKSGKREVKYDMQIFADRIEFCWTHLRGIGGLENSLWAYDGHGMRVWLNALSIEMPVAKDIRDTSEIQKDIKESVNIPLDFYPLSVLMDKGIIIGAEHEAIARSNLPFVIFRHATSSHLFLHHVLQYHLESQQVKEAVILASHYKHLVFFAHALEILLHDVMELDASLEASPGHLSFEDSILRNAVIFLDHFDVSLDVVVGCARKTEMTRWRRLFDIVGNPKTLFETCLLSQRLRTAASYLLVLHSLDQLSADHDDSIRLLKCAMDGKDWQLCRELLRFMHSIDESGEGIRQALVETDLLENKSDMPEINGIGVS
ncbi:RIC1-domain-containing protein [Fistulina hepatica ATCC 64428]|uniref:RIC1-domain-containing protein n=1 Tax=Fistulina hepatica ATCC 64428 TaxID=1128425 RepID=A0A0D7AIB7_9AGAR|nr:RIC1-domain-containing protein [Fistulina hepatica ATCC 64428]